MLPAIWYNFEVPRSKTIMVRSLEELVTRFLKAKWLRIDIEFDDWRISIANNSFIAWQWYESMIEWPEYSGDWYDIESFDDLIDEIMDQPELISLINKKYPQWLMKSDYSSLYLNKK